MNKIKYVLLLVACILLTGCEYNNFNIFFSETYHLFYEKEGNIIKVSKIKSIYDYEIEKYL